MMTMTDPIVKMITDKLYGPDDDTPTERDHDARIALVETLLVKRIGDRMRRSPNVRRRIAAEIVNALDNLDVDGRSTGAYEIGTGMVFENSASLPWNDEPPARNATYNGLPTGT